MKVDVTHEINSARRTVGTRVLEAGEALTVTITRVYDTDLDNLWDACTNPERIPRWFLPVSGDLRPGGHYRLEGNASGKIERCDPPHGFAATWEYGGEVSWIEVRLTTEPEGRARFELEHIAHIDDQRAAEFGPGAVGVGWDLAILGLALYLTSGEAVDPQESMAWLTSPNGREFVTLSSNAWYEANVAAGADPTTARAAADRTTAAYTGS
jgi:uncharacterized protein YndB with AHSA1/START domain